MARKVRFACFGHAEVELRRLRALWLSLQFGFEVAGAQIKDRVRGNKAVGISPLTLANGTKVTDSHYDFIGQTKSQMPRYAREVIFVRLISTLEVFLIDLVRDIFVHDSSLFHDQKKILEISHAELLGTNDLTHLRNRLINGELRQLHSKGMRETAKYFDARLGLGFASLGLDLATFWEMVDRRHLLVHRLGRADEQYRKKYGYDKKAALTISAEYLELVLNLADQFVAKMDARASEVIAPPADRPDSAVDRIEVHLEAAATSTEGDLALRPGFVFVVNDRDVGERTAVLRDILTSDQPLEDGGRILQLGGTTDETDSYVRELRRRERRGLLTYVILNKKRIKHRASSRNLRSPEDGVLHAVARRLPAEPWPTGIHKEIAAELGISKSACSRAITVIRNDPDLYVLMGTRLPSDNTDDTEQVTDAEAAS
jgi:hypothetical protein